MAQRRGAWHGTLMLVGQPAEEIWSGASAMLADGLFTRFPKPDYAISMHDEPSLPSGQVGFHAGFFRASPDAVDVTIFGRSTQVDLSVQTGAGERIWRFTTRRESRSKVNCQDHLPDKPMAHQEQAPEAIRIPPAPDAGAATVAAGAPAQVAVRTFIVR